MTITGSPAICVVVPFRNTKPYLGDALESIVHQSAAGGCEIIAVDNGSTDGSRRLVESYVSRGLLTIVDAPRMANPAYARNVGVRASHAQKLMFVDADDAIAPGYVDALSRALDASPLVTSRVDSVKLNPEWVRAAHGVPWQAEGVSVFFDFLPATGVNIGVRRDVFERLGGFSEYVSPCDDLAFSWHAWLTLEVAPRFVEDALYFYRYRDSIRALHRQAVWWGRAQVRLYEHFRAHGMPGRPSRVAIGEWIDVTRGLACARTAADRAALTVRLGCCAGRLQESLRRRVAFF